MKYLILGGNFTNKGAQSMLFVTLEEVSKRDENAEFFLETNRNTKQIEKNFNFRIVPINYRTQLFILGGWKGLKSLIMVMVKNLILFIRRRKEEIINPFYAMNMVKGMDCMIDISGYHLGDCFSDISNEYFLNYIELSDKLNIPIYLMPQSIGPFQFSNEKLLEKVKATLPRAKMIMVREQEGYDALRQMGVKNVICCDDLVLQTEEMKTEHVYRNIPEFHIPEIEKGNNVGIVPNIQCLKRGNERDILSVYFFIIEQLISQGKHVYVFSHSSEDMQFCRKIKSLFEERDEVKIISQDMSCFEYDKFVRQFDYIIVSRYHALVHAYRNDIPCIVLGWARKYIELTQRMEQMQYVFNLTRLDRANKKRIFDSVIYMEQSWKKEKEIIHTNLKKIQKDNCFDFVFNKN